jgi:uncharacterized membrane protein YdjX (TVP38/TMEM64 family)
MQPDAIPAEFALPRLLRDRRLWLAAGVLGVMLAIHASGLPGSLTLDALRENRHEIVAFAGEHRAISALCFVCVYVIVVALSLPSAALLTISGGFVFGAALGASLTVTGATIGATLLFLFARRMTGENAMAHFGETGAKLACAIRANAWSYLLMLRLLPLFPFFLVNVIPAFAGVRLSTFVLTTFFGIIPATVVFSMSGAGLGQALDQGGEFSIGSILTPEILAALGGLALLALAAIPLKRRFGEQFRRSSGGSDA